MPATAASVGFGSKVEISTDGSTYTQIDEVFGLTPPGATITNPVATHMQSPNSAVERIPGKVIDYGQTSFQINWIPGSDADVLIRGLVTGGSSFTVRETFPGGVQWSLTGLLAAMTPATPLDDRMTCDITLDVSGALTTGTESAPTNTVLPAISGVAQEDAVLTAYEGVWTGTPTFTYAWKRDGVAISGATSRTYTLVAADVDAEITVTVTGTNSAGSASATSLGTEVVIAAA
jgi:hypothetical protein